jgi:hypothetical protein
LAPFGFMSLQASSDSSLLHGISIFRLTVMQEVL